MHIQARMNHMVQKPEVATSCLSQLTLPLRSLEQKKNMVTWQLAPESCPGCSPARLSCCDPGRVSPCDWSYPPSGSSTLHDMAMKSFLPNLMWRRFNKLQIQMESRGPRCGLTDAQIHDLQDDYVYMYKCQCVCMYVCAYVSTHARTHACTHARMHARMHVCLYVYMHMYSVHFHKKWCCLKNM